MAYPLPLPPINWCWNPDSYDWSWGLWRLWTSVFLPVNKARSHFPGLWGRIHELTSVECLDRPLPSGQVLLLLSLVINVIPFAHLFAFYTFLMPRLQKSTIWTSCLSVSILLPSRLFQTCTSSEKPSPTSSAYHARTMRLSKYLQM